MIIYNAGSDPLVGDPLGRMNISEKGMIKSDEIVFKVAQEHRIPILYLTFGGYTKKSAYVIGKSLENIWQKIINSGQAKKDVVPRLFR